jgi:hypothetical protein
MDCEAALDRTAILINHSLFMMCDPFAFIIAASIFVYIFVYLEIYLYGRDPILGGSAVNKYSPSDIVKYNKENDLETEN